VNAEDTRIADRAAELFHAYGITASGVDALSRAAGISKRTLYERIVSNDFFDLWRTIAWRRRSTRPGGRRGARRL